MFFDAYFGFHCNYTCARKIRPHKFVLSHRISETTGSSLLMKDSPLIISTKSNSFRTLANFAKGTFSTSTIKHFLLCSRIVKLASWLRANAGTLDFFVANCQLHSINETITIPTWLDSSAMQRLFAGNS